MEIKKLSELCVDIIDCPHSTPIWRNNGIPVIRNYNLIDGNIDMTSLSYVDEETYKNRIKRAVPEEGDIIISREAPMGVVGIVPPNFKCCLGQRLVLLKIDKSKYDPYYVINVLMSKFVQTQIHHINKTGSIVSNLNISDLENLDIPIIVENQCQKGEVFKNINDNILLNNRIIDELHKLGDDLYNYYFTQYANYNGNFKFSKIHKKYIPDNWEVKNIEELCKLEKGYEPGAESYLTTPSDNTIEFYRVSDLETKNPLYIEKKDYNIPIVNFDEVLVSFDGSVGRVGIGYNGSYSTGIKKAVTIKKDISNGLLYFLFRSQYVKKTIEKYATGTVLKHASSSIPYINIPYDESDFNSFSELITPLYSTLLSCIKENEKLKQYYKFIAPLLINGQVSFKD